MASTLSEELDSAPTVLFVDDDIDVPVVMAQLLTDKDYNVVQSTDGKSALQTLAKLAPDAMIVDYIMPGMTGIEVAVAR